MFPAQVGERLDFPHTLPTAHFWRSLWACGTGDGSGERRGGWYLAKVLGGASAILMTQALVVLCFAVATLCCFLEVGKGGRVVPIPHVLCPCKKAQGVNFPTSSARYPQASSFPFGAGHLHIFPFSKYFTGLPYTSVGSALLYTILLLATGCRFPFGTSPPPSAVNQRVSSLPNQ